MSTHYVQLLKPVTVKQPQTPQSQVCDCATMPVALYRKTNRPVKEMYDSTLKDSQICYKFGKMT